jgi:hypothetical protein
LRVHEGFYQAFTKLDEGKVAKALGVGRASVYRVLEAG